ncbi:MAG: response regulator transcription factor [Parvularculaceae bacterium]|nr:response regulator transcription factor [Parvularculaceae bacterium]
MAPLKVLVVDDEKPARARLIRAISSMDSVRVVGEADSGEAAVSALVKHQPEIVLLDIDMPHGDGFYVVEEAMKLGLVPEVIFVTAYDRFAIAAFEVGAIDYLLKPTEVARIQLAIDRAAQRHHQRSADERAAALQAVIQAGQERGSASSEDLWLREGGQSIRVPMSSLLTVEADRDYVKLSTADRFFHVRGTIGEYEKKLEDHGFLRIHRSAIVRLDAITRLCSKGTNAYEVELLGSRRLPVGRSHNKIVKQLLLPN